MAAAASLLPPASPAAIGMRFSRRAASGKASAARPTARRASAIPASDGVEAGRVERPAVEPPTTWRLSSAPAGAGEAQPVRERERDHDRVELVEPVGDACRAPRA